MAPEAQVRCAELPRIGTSRKLSQCPRALAMRRRSQQRRANYRTNSSLVCGRDEFEKEKKDFNAAQVIDSLEACLHEASLHLFLFDKLASPDSKDKPSKILGQAHSYIVSNDKLVECAMAPVAQETASDVLPMPADSDSMTLGPNRSVRFDLNATTVHEVVPFAEIYGTHPREFVFDRSSCKIPAVFGGFISLQSLFEPDDEDPNVDAESDHSDDCDELILFRGCVVEDAELDEEHT